MQDIIYDALYQRGRYHWWLKTKREIVVQLAKDAIANFPDSGKEPKKLLDYGCGSGLMLSALQPLGEVTGMDISERALAYCRNMFSGHLVKQDITKIEQSELKETYHVISALDILEHLEEDTMALNRMYDLLLPGGTCIIAVPAFQFLWSQHDVNCMHKRRYTYKSLESIIAKTKFKTTYLSYYNFILFAPTAVIRIIAEKLHLNPDSKLENNFSDNWLNTLLYRIFSLEKKFIFNQRKMPFGVSLIAVLQK